MRTLSERERELSGCSVVVFLHKGEYRWCIFKEFLRYCRPEFYGYSSTVPVIAHHDTASPVPVEIMLHRQPVDGRG